MSIYFAGNDQFQILSRKKRCDSFLALKSDFVFEDCFLDWDLALYSSNNHGFKSWFIKGIITENSPLQIYPGKNSKAGPSKGVIAGDIIYILNQADFVLYSVNISLIVRKTSSENVKEFTMEKVAFDQEDEPKIVDISSSGKDCFAIDSLGGIYAVPKFLYRMEDLRWTGIYSGYAFNVLRSDTGAVYSCGNGSRGELGQRSVKLTCELPSRIDFFDDLPSTIISVACGGWHSLALTSDGDIYSWGWNESGQLGHSSEKLSAINVDPYPVDLGSADDPVEKICVGARHSVAVLKSGKLFSWGCNKFGQLGLGDCESRSIPTEVKIPSVSQVQCGRWATLIRTT